ncbi:phosphoethanolamine transferase [Pasteurella multocida]|nr:phosphoethanolamine transferase [Pasteurella multocida]
MMKLDFIFSRIKKEQYFLLFSLGLYVVVSHFILCLSLTFLSLLGSFIFWFFVYHLSLRLFNFLFSSYTVLVGLMLPLHTYGGINLSIVSSMFESNLSEGIEYISTLSYYQFFYILLYFTFGFLILYKPVKEYLKGRGFSLLNIRVYPIQVVYNIYHLTSSYFEQKDMLERGVNTLPNWNIQSVDSKYDNYVLVIGESMRADYMSLYGYPIDTTPFLKKTKEIIFDNYISSAPNTQPSLLHSLYDKEGYNIKANNNIINLANLAGFNTYWISNQGILGYADTAASRVGVLSQNHVFTKKGGYDDSRINDFKLLEYFDKFTLDLKKSKNLFVFHLMGSHADFCTRLNYLPEVYFINQDMSCYLETIKQTDLFLEKLVEKLSRLGSYSLIYFSDHGLSHADQGSKNLTLKHGNKFKENYHVPFIQIASDNTEQKRIQASRSGMNFLNGFAEWLGIEEPSLKLPYSFFSEDEMNSPLKVFDWEKYIDFDLLLSDPAISS